MEPTVPLGVPLLPNRYKSLQHNQAEDIQPDHARQTTAPARKIRKKRKPSKASKKDRRATQEGMEPPKRLKSFKEYRIWVADHCKDWQLVQTLYS